MKWYPPYLEFFVRLRARRPKKTRTGRVSCTKDYWRWRFSVDTSLIKPDEALRKMLDVFDVKVASKTWGSLRSSLLRSLEKAEEDIPVPDRANYKRDVLTAKKPIPPLSEKEKTQILLIAKKKSILPADLLALPLTYQRKLIGWYIQKSKRDYVWLYRQGYRYRLYKRGVPTSMFTKPVFREESTHRLRR